MKALLPITTGSTELVGEKMSVCFSLGAVLAVEGADPHFVTSQCEDSLVFEDWEGLVLRVKVFRGILRNARMGQNTTLGLFSCEEVTI